MKEMNLLDELSQALMIVNFKGQYTTFINKSCKKLLGIQTDENDFSTIELVDIFIHEWEYETIRERIISLINLNGTCEVYDILITPRGGKRFRCNLNAGYVDRTREEVYVVLKSIWDVDEVGSFPSVIREFPEPVVVVALNDSLSYKYGNESFHCHFSEDHRKFNDFFEKSLYEAMNPAKRKGYLLHIRESVRKNRNFKLEIELLDAMGRFRTVDLSGVQIQLNSKDSDILLYCKISIIDHKVEQIKKLEADQAFFDTVYQLSHDLLFRLDLKTATIHYYGPIMKAFGLSPIEENYPHFLLERNIIHEDDIECFSEMCRQMFRGNEHPTPFRVFNKEGKQIWYECDYMVTRDSEGNPIDAVGMIRNKQEEKRLEEKMNTDPLTGCMTKAGFEEIVTHTIQENEGDHAIFVLDIDNFKGINDNLGHHFGDIVLKEIGEGMREIFRESDFVGRIGGDEFMIFLRNVSSKEALELKAKQVLAILNKVYRGNQQSYRISGSVGIAKYPEDGITFHELYVNGDKALYESKHRGKNTYTFYTTALSHGTTEVTTIDARSRNDLQTFDQGIIADIFSLVFNTSDVEFAIGAVLRRLGTRYGLHRNFVYQISSDESHYYNVFEWCNNGIEESRDDEKVITNKEMHDLFAQADDNRVFTCADFDTLTNQDTANSVKKRGVKSFVVSFLAKEEKVQYAIGFEDYLRPRTWKPSEIGTLVYASKILSQCLEYNKLWQTTLENNK
ncbi:MAG: sensor domain-containing diguanylate cyclase [Eubacteriales bacterium]